MKHFFKRLLLIIPIAIVIQFGSAYILDVILNILNMTSQYSEEIDSFTVHTTEIILYTCVIMPFLEELVFRLGLITLLKRKTSFILANIIQAALFGLYHMHLIQGVYAFILGMVLGYIYHIGGGFFSSLFTHALINSSGLFLVSYLPDSLPIPVKLILGILCTICLIFLLKELKHVKK